MLFDNKTQGNYIEAMRILMKFYVLFLQEQNIYSVRLLASVSSYLSSYSCLIAQQSSLDSKFACMVVATGNQAEITPRLKYLISRREK